MSTLRWMRVLITGATVFFVHTAPNAIAGCGAFVLFGALFYGNECVIARTEQEKPES